jgi:hypothetical protein
MPSNLDTGNRSSPGFGLRSPSFAPTCRPDRPLSLRSRLLKIGFNRVARIGEIVVGGGYWRMVVCPRSVRLQLPRFTKKTKKPDLTPYGLGVYPATKGYHSDRQSRSRGKASGQMHAICCHTGRYKKPFLPQLWIGFDSRRHHCFINSSTDE